MKDKKRKLFLALLVLILAVQGILLTRISRGQMHTVDDVKKAMNTTSIDREAERRKQERDEAKLTQTPSPEPAVEASPTPEPWQLEDNALIQPSSEVPVSVEGLADLRQQLETMTAVYEGDWSVYVEDPAAGEYMALNSHQVKAASLIKLYIMGAVLQQVEIDQMELDQTVNQFLNSMITVSDNYSANELVKRLSPDGTDPAQGMAQVNAFAAEEGYGDTFQGRELSDTSREQPEAENYTSVLDCGLFLNKVYHGKCVSAQASEQMLELLKLQTRTSKIPAGVPVGSLVANKTGELADTESDAAIVYTPGGDYILCVIATGLSDTAAARANITTISSTVYQYFNPVAADTAAADQEASGPAAADVGEPAA